MIPSYKDFESEKFSRSAYHRVATINAVSNLPRKIIFDPPKKNCGKFKKNHFFQGGRPIKSEWQSLRPTIADLKSILTSRIGYILKHLQTKQWKKNHRHKLASCSSHNTFDSYPSSSVLFVNFLIHIQFLNWT